MIPPGVAGYRGYEVIAMKRGCCESTFEAEKVQGILNTQHAAGRELIWIWHEDQSTCCGSDDRLMLVFRVK
jgi:hypothetical protein